MWQILTLLFTPSLSFKCLLCYDGDEGCREGIAPSVDCEEEFGRTLNKYTSCLKIEHMSKFNIVWYSIVPNFLFLYSKW